MAKKASKKKPTRKSMKLYKNINSSSLSINVESNNRIEHTTSNSRFASNTLQYLDIATILGGETTFTEMASRFSMYRINGIKLEARSIFEPNSTTNLEHVVFWVGFFPSVTASYIGGTAVSNYDKALITSTNQTLMSRKMTFYNNYFEGTGAGGYGTWNSVSTVSQMTGSIQIVTNAMRTAFLATASLFHLRIILNITFKEKQLTG